SEYRGARLAQHGEVAGLPWRYEVVTDTEREVAIRLHVRTRRLPYRLERTLRLRSGTAALGVEGRAVNESGLGLHAMWGHHLVYGTPFLRPGARIRLPEAVKVIPHETAINPPARRVSAGGPWDWPVVPADGGGEVDLSVVPARGTPSDIVYLTGFETGWYEVTADLGLRVEWDAGVLPYLWLWQEL